MRTGKGRIFLRNFGENGICKRQVVLRKFGQIKSVGFSLVFVFSYLYVTIYNYIDKGRCWV